MTLGKQKIDGIEQFDSIFEEAMTQTAAEERKYKVERLFRIGYAEFNDGFPCPENRIKSMGWRLAEQQALLYQQTLEQAIEAFAEIDRWNDLGYLD